MSGFNPDAINEERDDDSTGGREGRGEEWAEHVMFASMRAEGKSAFNAGIINGGAAHINERRRDANIEQRA